MESGGTDGRVLERLKAGAEREERLKQELDTTMLLLGSLLQAYFHEDVSVPLPDMAIGRALHAQKIVAWWEERGPWYCNRVAREEAAQQAAARNAEIKRKRIARAALLKLTPEERRALGVSSGKRV